MSWVKVKMKALAPRNLQMTHFLKIHHVYSVLKRQFSNLFQIDKNSWVSTKTYHVGRIWNLNLRITKKILKSGHRWSPKIYDKLHDKKVLAIYIPVSRKCGTVSWKTG